MLWVPGRHPDKLQDAMSGVKNGRLYPSIHLWRYSLFRAMASLIRRLHSSLFASLLLHPHIPSSCSASLWTTSAHLVLGLPTGLVVSKFPFRTFLESFLLTSLLYDPPILVFSFWCPPQCLAPCISCTVQYSIWDASIPSHVLGHIFFAIFSFQTCLASALTFVLSSELRLADFMIDLKSQYEYSELLAALRSRDMHKYAHKQIVVSPDG